MSDIAKSCLNRIMDKADTQPDRVRDVLLARDKFSDDSKNPYPFRDASHLKEFHQYLIHIAQDGAIELEWERHHEGSSLCRIRLINKHLLAKTLGRSLLEERLEAARKSIEWPPSEHWMYLVYGEVFEAWKKGKSKFGMSLDDAEKLELVLKAMRGISSMPPGLTLDYRQFGARYLADSKAISKISGPMSRIYRSHRNTSLSDDLSKTDVLAEMNLVKMAHPVLIYGPVLVRGKKTDISADVQPYIGIPTELLDDIEITSKPYYLLTIENLSSFLEYTSTIEPRGIVIYTAGYPTRRLQRLYGMLASQTKCPKYHWGDSDPDGFQILKTLQQSAPSSIVFPHSMDYPDGELFDERQLYKLKKLNKVNPEVDQIIERCIKSRRGRTEQEQQPAIEPACYLT